ncbi:MAG: CHAT domain-containing protein [Acidobacteriota bacterium]
MAPEIERKSEDESLLRRYLLGELMGDERQEVEKRLLIDSHFFDRALLIEDDLIDQYARDELSRRDRKLFEREILSTPEGRERVMLVSGLIHRASKQAALSNKGSGRAFTLPLRAAVAATILLVAGAGVWRVFFYRSDIDKGLLALRSAYRERPVEARISGFDYARWGSVRGDQQSVDQSSRDRAERILLDAVFEQPGPASRHALGKFYLSERKFDEAIAQFEESLKADSNNAQLHNDYGAALLEKGKAEQSSESGRGLEYPARGLERFDRAIELRPSLLDALFNRALCLKSLNLPRQAAQAWKKYLEKDTDSAWAEEARRNLDSTVAHNQRASQSREQLFQDFLDACKARDDARAWNALNQSYDTMGSFIANRLIDDYLDLNARGHSEEAGEILKKLSYAGDLEYRQARDRFLLDLIRFYKTATPAQRKNILRARRWMKSGFESFNKTNFEEALGFYNKAKETFERAGDVCQSARTAYLTGICYLQQAKPEPAMTILQGLAQRCKNAQYKRLLAQILYHMANANQALRDFSAAISNSSLSLKLSEEMGDRAGYATTIHQLADEYRFINNCQKSLDLHAQGLLRALISLPQPSQIWRNYFSISRTLDQLDLPSAAIDFQREALQLAIEAETPRLVCRSYNYLGFMLAREGDYRQAAEHIERAIEIGNSFAEKRVRTEAIAYSFLQLGYVYRKSGDFDKAIESYDQAIQNYDQLGSAFFVYTARKAKLLCCLAQGECPWVEQEMKTLLDLFEQHRLKILEESNRSSFFDGEQNIYDVAIEFEYSRRGDAKKAYDYSERSRARSLRDAIDTKVKIVDDPQSPDVTFNAALQPMGVEEIQARLPDQAQILQYSLLKDRLLIWVISRDDFLSESQSISAETLSEKVRSYLQMIASPREEDAEASMREAIYLYDVLIRPVEGALDSGRHLCIVPDKILNYLPFGALMSETSGKYFIEEHRFALSPSSNIFILCSEAARRKGASGSEKVLSVGNPTFDREAFSKLADLPSAAREAEMVAGCYGSAPITGASATKERVKSEMERADVIHLATHAIADEWNPMRSKLLLAKYGKADLDGVLQAYEIYNLNLDRARLVVLSACRTGVEKYYEGEGMIGLSRPFIAKRVPIVVASLWPVDSDSTARLMISFHRYRKRGFLTTEALRRAQLDMLRGANSRDRLPYNWASFVAIGGRVNF